MNMLAVRSTHLVYKRALILSPDEFIADAGIEGEEDYDAVRRTADHARYDRRVREMDDRDLEQVAEDISQRYRRTAVRYTGEMSDVPQRLLMPSVHDANLWQVRVRVSVLYPLRNHPYQAISLLLPSPAKNVTLSSVSCGKLSTCPSAIVPCRYCPPFNGIPCQE